MPAFETMDKPQRATYWPKIGVNKLGQPVVGNGVEISVQWDNRSSEQLDRDGNSITVDATMFTNLTLTIGTVVRYGSLSDWQGTGSSLLPEGLMEIKTVNITPDIKGRNQVYFYGMMRYNDVLPRS